jgi:hypothetical protein
MYFSAAYKNVKLKQDYANCKITEDFQMIIICDGIGSFKDSGIVASKIGNDFIQEVFKSIENISNDTTFLLTHDGIEEGGTTIILAKTEDNKSVTIEYIGNGGAINLTGDFADTPYSEYPYRYSELILPHVDSRGALSKHLSHNSGIEQLTPSKITLYPNHPNGNIILIYSDGINSLENNLILKDRENRFWRNESPSIQYILNLLDSFLIELCKERSQSDTIQDGLYIFNKNVLDALEKEGYLEDDASLGIIITQPVLDYYQSKSND